MKAGGGECMRAGLRMDDALCCFSYCDFFCIARFKRLVFVSLIMECVFTFFHVFVHFHFKIYLT